MPAYQITPSDTLLCQYGKTIGVRDIFWYSKVTPIHAFQVKDAHTYFVTHHSVLAHNYAMVLQGLQAIEWVIGTGLVLLVELEQARQGFLAEFAVQEAAKKAAQKTAEKVAEKVVEQASKKVLEKTVEIAVTKAPVIAQQTTTAVTTATQATTALKQAASVKQVVIHAQQATTVLQAPAAQQAAVQAIGGVTLGTALNVATALYMGYKLHRYYQDNYAYQCIYKKFQYNASQLAQVIEMTRLQASQEQIRALKQQIDTAIEEWEAECQRQAEAEKLARQQENERRIKQEEERKRVQQAKLEKLFEDTSSKWEIINQKFLCTAAVLKEAEPTYLARDKYSDKKKRLREEKKKKKGGNGDGGNGNNDDDPDDHLKGKYTKAQRTIEKENTPTSKEGYYPDKNCDGRKYPVPRNDGKYGYRDKKGNYWVPTGPDNYALSHGGRHWDLFDAKGHHIGNVYPGGFYRG